MIVRWQPEAELDRDRAVAYLEQLNPYAARRLLRDLIRAADSLETLAHRGRSGDVTDTRELIVGPYIMIYQIEADEQVAILRLWHTAQDR